jgi:hypothetical protein
VFALSQKPASINSAQNEMMKSARTSPAIELEIMAPTTMCACGYCLPANCSVFSACEMLLCHQLRSQHALELYGNNGPLFESFFHTRSRLGIFIWFGTTLKRVEEVDFIEIKGHSVGQSIKFSKIFN